jgi:hypothetical protein
MFDFKSDNLCWVVVRAQSCVSPNFMDISTAMTRKNFGEVFIAFSSLIDRNECLQHFKISSKLLFTTLLKWLCIFNYRSVPHSIKLNKFHVFIAE